MVIVTPLSLNAAGLCLQCGRCAGCHCTSCEMAALVYCVTGSCPLDYWDRSPLLREVRRLRSVEPGTTDVGRAFYDGEQPDFEDDASDPCHHCLHDNSRHRGDGCMDCGCVVPQ